MSKKENKQNSSSQPEDAFENEAAEGFGLLSEKESADIKAQTDQAIHQLLRTKVKKRVRPFYWLAAAMLILSGFAFFLFLRPAPAEPIAMQDLPHPSAPVELKEPLTKAVTVDETTAIASPAKTNEPDPINSVSKSSLKNAGHRASHQDYEVPASASNAAADEQMMELAEDQAEKETQKVAAAAPLSKSKRVREENESIVANSMTTSFKAKTQEQINLQLVTYKGGTAALSADIKKIVLSDSVSSPLRLNFYINSSARIEKLEFERPENMSPEKQKRLIKTISRLRGFEIIKTKGQIYPLLYVFNYVPD